MLCKKIFNLHLFYFLFRCYQVHSLTGRDLPKTVREKLKQSAPTVQNSNIRVQDFSGHKRRPGFLCMLDDSYLEPAEAPLDPTMQKTKYRDTFDRVLSTSTTSMTSPHGPRSSTPRRAEEVNMSFNVSGVPHGSPCSTRTDESLVTEKRSHDSKEPIKSAGTSNSANQSLRQVTKARTASTNQSVNQSANRSSGAKSKSTSNEPVDGPPKRNRKSAIMARAAFWDKRVDQGVSSDKEVAAEFPDMPVDSFKR